MGISKKLETIYYNGQPDGIRSIRRNLSTMTTYVIPRPLLAEARSISGIDRPGIYYLINENDDNQIAQLYIGQTRNGITRLDDHNRSKDFWNKAILFLAESQVFTLDMISGLEKFAIDKAQESKRYRVENSVTPQYKIREYDLVSVEEIYDEIQFIIATLGYKMNDAKTDSAQKEVFHTTRNGIRALGIYDGEKFEVLEGSQVSLAAYASLSPSVEKKRQSALQNGDMVLDGTQYRLCRSMSFTTPSAAACFVLGTSANGWTEWKAKNGDTLSARFR